MDILLNSFSNPKVYLACKLEDIRNVLHSIIDFHPSSWNPERIECNRLSSRRIWYSDLFSAQENLQIYKDKSWLMRTLISIEILFRNILCRGPVPCCTRAGRPRERDRVESWKMQNESEWDRRLSWYPLESTGHNRKYVNMINI